jgi:Flp pilus assembly pilin Flp
MKEKFGRPTVPPSRGAFRDRRRAKWWRASSGAVLVEYAFLLVGVAVPVMAALAAAGVQVVTGYGEVRNAILHVGP